ncbi:MAG TPA: anti-virulence regulator CigR family protein [Azospirillaceae bacterium]|nr:anti-virulence regulator CigR family protein [Azospirillaceae bacterium]
MLARKIATLTLSALLATAVTLPAHAKPEGKGEQGGQGQGGKGNADKGGAGKGGPEKAGGNKGGGNARGGGNPQELLQAGATAALVSGLLGQEAPRVLSVGAKPLPPGIRKNLARGKALPPGLAREPVPAPVLATLPRVDGHEWVRIGTELVLIGVASLVIAQVIEGVFS